MTIEQTIEGIIKREGPFVDHPDDKGGPTCWGVTETTARHYGYNGPMRDLPRDVAAQIYLKRYFKDPGFHKIFIIHPGIADEMVDSGVNCGPAQPIKWLQRALNFFNLQGTVYPDLVVDGDLGPATVDALRALLKKRGEDGATVILRALNCLQGAYYIDITEKRPANESFAFGWFLNRVQG